MAIMRVLLSACMVVAVTGHGAMVQPRSRNAIDWLSGINTQACSTLSGKKCQNGQGCFIGCAECDNASGRRQVDLCNSGMESTLKDPRYWSLNRDAIPGSELDIYRHNPWRAPGAAPVADACGLAGGSYARKDGAEAGDYIQTQYAQHGDVGTKVLAPLPAANYTPPTYTRGGTAEVVWSIRNNHGGGYQYRLCKTPENFTDLTEECFYANPLDFVRGESAVVFPNGTMLRLDDSQTTFVTEGTYPPGSTWAMMPMPPTLLGPCCLAGSEGYNSSTTPHTCMARENCYQRPGQPSAPCSPCPGTPGSDCSRCDQVNSVMPGRYKVGPPFPAPCAGCEGVSWSGYSVRDLVKIPENIPAGDYILGFRYDCEATAQVWSNCADVIIQ